jgi:GH15 family glucan-1,4-alpha-glucosidase
MRYDSTSSEHVDGLSGREGAFLACSFWLADELHLIGRHDEAVELFERLVALRNDLGLLAEEYDPIAKRQVGNFPQAFSHVSLVNTAVGLSQEHLGMGMTHRERLKGVKLPGRPPRRKRQGLAHHRFGLGH